MSFSTWMLEFNVFWFLSGWKGIKLELLVLLCLYHQFQLKDFKFPRSLICRDVESTCYFTSPKWPNMHNCTNPRYLNCSLNLFTLALTEEKLSYMSEPERRVRPSPSLRHTREKCLLWSSNIGRLVHFYNIKSKIDATH